MSGQRIGLRQSQRLQLNTALQTSIRLLRMDAGGLTRFLEEQAETNPYLRVEAPPVVPGQWLPRWSQAFSAGSAPEAAATGPSLMSHVLTEIDALTRSSRERQIALVLAEALEPSGWLGVPLEVLARRAGCATGDAAAVLKRLQRMEPAGLFAEDLSDCLRIQAEEAGVMDPVMEVCLDNLPLLAEGAIGRLARLAACEEADVLRRIRVIRSFDPKPGAQFDPGTVDAREPDLVVTRSAGGWDVQLNRSALPAVAVVRPGSRPAQPEERARLAAALELTRMLERRNATLLRIAREVLSRQSAALEAGLGALGPLRQTEIAEALGLNDSTVSRAVAGVAVATPLGTWRMVDLFATQLGDSSGPAIRSALTRLIAAENPRRPLSDRALAEALGLVGHPVARRTVTKYREMLRIPTAGQRRR
ncbi:RNA polymerase factor sigma-54 [Tabrizicola sp. J26]|uniref:RNA polymerase factor sigma-54 n=1 Tax=Alitabrizicola rongguiensis TaxID=2909234 RepID=UPI001F215889|nr:RNA polymerase factor sigma-54 [Tabrizicola rongguiensis]MCF1707949.1 RNA polymerase factor sigma-54 [Tabrizicola rongguiensis]